jgi:hypothetical protein
VALIAAVLERKPTEVRELRTETPRTVAQTVMRCLEKDPARRFPTYAALRAALTPFGSGATTPAKPGLRFFAGVIDTLFTLWIELIALSVFGETTDALLISNRTASSFAFWFSSVAWAIAWFGASEALFGTRSASISAGCAWRRSKVGRQGQSPLLPARSSTISVFW